MPTLRDSQRVVLHIGFVKCASTSLQATLGAAERGFAGQSVAYPSFGGGGKKRQAPIYAALSGRDAASADRVCAALAAEEVRAADTLVLSAESLVDHDPAALRTLLQRAGHGGRHWQVLAIVRDPVGWLNSGYGFSVARAFAQRRTVEGFCRRSLAQGAADWDARLAPWFGVADVSVLPIASRIDARPVIARAFAAMDLPLPEQLPARQNEAFDPRTVEAAWRLRRDVTAANRQRVRSKLARLAEAEGWSGRYWGVSPAMAERITAATARSNEALASKVWRQRWDEAVAEAELPELNVHQPGNRADEAAIVRVVDTVRNECGLQAPVGGGVLGGLRRLVR